MVAGQRPYDVAARPSLSSDSESAGEAKSGSSKRCSIVLSATHFAIDEDPFLSRQPVRDLRALALGGYLPLVLARGLDDGASRNID